MKLLYDNSPFGFAFCDLEGKLLDVNKKYEDILGYTFEELAQLTYWDITPRKYEADEAKRLESLEKTGEYGPYEKEYIRKDGSLVPVLLYGFIVEDYDGQRGIWSIVEDISEKIEIEEELKHQKQMAAHSAKLASIGVLAGGVSHEINNPLMIVKGYLTNIKNKLKQEEKPTCEEMEIYIDKINNATDRIAKIVKGLKSFSRVDKDEIEIFDTLKEINDSVSLLKDIYEKEDVHLNVSLPENMNTLSINGHRGKFQQVLMNLISNAHDAVSGKEIKIIDLRIKSNEKNVIITVRDNGSGIPEDIKDKIFDPFFTTKDVNRGTGIGLSLVHSFVEEMDGTISVDSKVDTGTAFTLTFPIAH